MIREVISRLSTLFELVFSSTVRILLGLLFVVAAMVGSFSGIWGYHYIAEFIANWQWPGYIVWAARWTIIVGMLFGLYYIGDLVMKKLKTQITIWQDRRKFK